MNQLYYGDNLEVLRLHIKDQSVDLVYLDPPFNSQQDYNVLYQEQDGTRSAAQIKVFGDTWRWDKGSAAAYEEVVLKGGDVADAMRAFRTFLGENDMLAYLAMMAPRLIELRRVMKPTCAIYLHCDPTASHYLKMLMDAVFDPRNFRNEIIWQRTLSKALMTRRLPDNHDVILGYQRTSGGTWNISEMFRPYDPTKLDEKTAAKYALRDAAGRRYQLTSLINPNANRPHLTYEFLGVKRVWRWTKKRMKKAYDAGLVVQPKPGGVPRFKRYLDKQRGKSLGDVWTDIPPINSQAQERLGYPTQKPEALLERIIRLTTTPDAVVLDPFCGCGTTIAAAQKLKRSWIGIDITHLAITLIRHRLTDTFGPTVKDTFKVIGEPVSLPDARTLASQDPHQFEWWALGRVDARPAEPKKGADRGIDGRAYFIDPTKSNGDRIGQIIFSVKAGHITPAHVRELRGVVDRERAAIGVLITMEKPTSPMNTEAASAGFYTSPWGKHPRIQTIMVEDLLAGKRIDAPPAGQVGATFKKAPAALPARATQIEIPEAEVAFNLSPVSGRLAKASSRKASRGRKRRKAS